METENKVLYRDLIKARKYLELRKVVLVRMFLAWTLIFYSVGVVMFMEQMGVSSFQMGFTLTTAVIGSILGHNLSSVLITRFQHQPKRVTRICMPILLVCNAQFIWAIDSYHFLTLMFFSKGVLTGVNFTSVNVIYRRLLPDNKDTRENIRAKFIILGNTSAGISGYVVTSFIEKPAWNFSDVLFGIVVTCVLYRIRVPEQTTTATTIKITSPLSLKWKLVVIGLPILNIAVVTSIITAYFPLTLESQSGILITVYYVVNGISGDLVTRMLQKTSRRKLINGCLILIGISCLSLNFMGHSFILLLVVAVIFGLTSRGILTFSMTEMEGFAEPRANNTSASVNSTFQTIFETGTVAGGYFASFLASNPFLWCVVALLSGFILLNRATLEKKLYRE